MLVRSSNPSFSQSRRSGFFSSSKNRAADQMGGGFMSRKQKQEDHRYHFIATDLAAVPFDLHELSDKPMAAFARTISTWPSM